MIVVLGSTNLDQIGIVTRLPQPGETVSGNGFSLAPGGKGANQALAARRAGAAVALFSAVGNDGFADLALELLQSDGVDLSGVARTDVHTGIAMILVDPKGENVIAVLPGANATVGEGQVEAALKALVPSDILMLQQEIPYAVNRLALERAKALGVRTVLNIAPFVPQTKAIAGLASIVIANETEFALLAGEFDNSLEERILDLSTETGQTIIVTLGADGICIGSEGKLIRVASWPVEVLDTVGAGDTFCGYLAASLERGDDLEMAARRAAKAASISCTMPGAQPSIPYDTET